MGFSPTFSYNERVKAMKQLDESSKIGWITHTYGPIDPKVYFNHLGCMLKWSRKFNVVFLGIDKHRTAEARDILIASAIAEKCTHLLIVDADHILPHHTLPCLAMNDDCSIASGLITKRKPPYAQVGFVVDSEKKHLYNPIQVPLDNQSYNVDVPAMGCTLIDIEVFDDLEAPFFLDCIEEKEDGTLYNKRSDTRFFENVRATGRKIVVDTRVLVGHMRDAQPIYPNCVPSTKALNKEDRIRQADDSLKHQAKVYDVANEIGIKYDCDSVLDLGCGNPAKLLSIFDNVVGIDFPEKILDIAASAIKVNHNARWIGHDLDDGIDMGSKFDIVICSDVIEHVNDPDMLLENAARHMSDESFLVISSPERTTVKEDNPLHVKEFSFEELKATLLANGFEIVDHEQYEEVTMVPYTNNVFVCKLRKKE